MHFCQSGRAPFKETIFNRTETDFVAALKQFIAAHAGHTVYHFVADQINTRKSEALVRFVAEFCGTVLAAGARRLSDDSHRLLQVINRSPGGRDSPNACCSSAASSSTT